MRIVIAVLLAWALSGCANNELIVLLPDEDGKVGALDVTNKGGTVELNQALAAARAGEDSVQKAKVTQDQVQQTFGAALAAEPPAPVAVWYGMPAPPPPGPGPEQAGMVLV